MVVVLSLPALSVAFFFRPRLGSVCDMPEMASSSLSVTLSFAPAATETRCFRSSEGTRVFSRFRARYLSKIACAPITYLNCAGCRIALMRMSFTLTFAPNLRGITVTVYLTDRISAKLGYARPALVIESATSCG